jgi:hypothetical protein
MNRITLLLVTGILFCTTAYGLQRNNMQVVDEWIQKSEQVVIKDSVLRLIAIESNQKHIPTKVMNKNLVYFKMLFNLNFSKEERIRIANYIIEVFRGYENTFALNVVLDTKENLLAK